ncbi:MAG: NAD(P)H-binding protein, partial [Actinomycetota bacterium]|nr:NAD(P)H-binding protein [Actinomycetota bacterium]
MRVLVTGATGFIGAALLPGLISGGHEVVAATRRPQRYQGPGEAVGFDVDDPASVDAALAGCDAAYYLVHGMADTGDFVARDRRAAEAFGAAARRHRVKVVYLGGLGDHEASAERSAHLRSRHEVGRVLRERAETVELQAAIVIGNGSIAFEIMRQLVDRLPAMVCPSWVTTRSQPIAIDDMVRYLVAGLDLAAGAYQVGGADVLSYEQMMNHYAQVIGRRRVVLKVPVLTPRLSAHWIGLVTD